jgi:hypothetical protein
MKTKILFLIVFTISAVNSFAQQSLNIVNGCIRNCSGILYDTGGPTGDYQFNENKVLTIFAEETGQSVYINFTEFNLGFDGDDILYIYNDSIDNPAKLLWSGTGTNSPGARTANSGAMTIKFVSGPNTIGASVSEGWKATWTCLPKIYPITNGGSVSTCHALITSSGGLTSTYQTNENITYTVNTGNINSAFFIINQSCSFLPGEVLKIYDGPNTSGILLAQGQGSDIPDSIVGLSDYVTFHFTSNGALQSGGFIMEVVCFDMGGGSPMTNGSITADEGTFYDDGGLYYDYTIDDTLIYTINAATPNKALQMTFYEFEIDEPFDTLFIYDGSISPNNLLWAGYSRYDLPLTVTAPSGTMVFRFFSDYFIARRGWIANWKTVEPSSATQVYACHTISGIDSEEDGIYTINVYPNPSNGKFLIEMPTQKDENIQLRVTNMLGQTVFEENIFMSENNSKEIQWNVVSKGIYLLQIITGNNTVNRRIEVQ